MGMIAVPALVVATVLLLSIARAQPARQEIRHEARIVNGLNAHGYPTTGALLYTNGGQITEDNAIAWCSGTLIGCRTFLTAAHCVGGDTNPDAYVVYLQHAGIFSVTSVTMHPAYTDSTFPIADAAVLQLGTRVTGIKPSAVNQIDPAPFIPASGTIVGFGQTSGAGQGANDYGIKRVGMVETSNCPEDLPAGATDGEVICWTFSEPVGPSGEDSNTCNGDSGGPLFLDLGGGEVVAGITSGGLAVDCLATDTSYDTNVFSYRDFILGELGTDSTATCGGLPPVGDSMVNVIGRSGTLNSGNASDTFNVTLGSNVTVLRFGLNGEDNLSLRVNMYVKEGPGAGSANFDCKADGNSVFGACEIIGPDPGEWSVYIERRAGSGEYQVTTTIFTGDPLVCGNDMAEVGEQCDGTDDGACPGHCQGDCTCPQPECGNGIVEGGEECDGADDAACPGACEPDCACQMTCSVDDVFDIRARSTARRFTFRALLDNFSGTFDSLDPRGGFSVALVQGAHAVAAAIPPGSVGWERSRPDRGRYIWKGDLVGIRSVRAIDKSSRSGTWRISVRGRLVPGAETIDTSQPFDVLLTMDGTCTETTY
jgi:hypothetical protein